MKIVCDMSVLHVVSGPVAAAGPGPPHPGHRDHNQGQGRQEGKLVILFYKSGSAGPHKL